MPDRPNKRDYQNGDPIGWPLSLHHDTSSLSGDIPLELHRHDDSPLKRNKPVVHGSTERILLERKHDGTASRSRATEENPSQVIRPGSEESGSPVNPTGIVGALSMPGEMIILITVFNRRFEAFA